MPTPDGEFREVLSVSDNQDRRCFRATLAPVVTDTFRLVMHASASTQYPNAAQISELELYPPERP